MKLQTFLVGVLTIFIFSCKKTELAEDVVPLSSGVDAQIRFVENLDGRIIMGGGARGKNGFLLEYLPNSGVVQLTDTLSVPLYNGHLNNGRYIFGTEDGTIIYSRDLLSYFRHYLKEVNFVPELNQRPGRDIVSIENHVFLASGGEYQFGLIQQNTDTFQSWPHETFENELRTLFIQENGILWAGGFGILMRSQDNAASWNRLDLDKEFITDIIFKDANNGVLITFDGDIYYTKDGGENWIKSKIEGRQGYLSKVKWLANGTIVAVGYHGTICKSQDDGKNWTCGEHVDGKDINDLCPLGDNKFIAVGEKGMVWLVQLKF